jgi:sortase A
MFAEKKAIAQNSDNKNVQQVDSKPPQIGDTIGILEIPRVKAAELAIVEGTDPDVLEKGVGHYKGSSLPSQNGQIVFNWTSRYCFSKVRGIKNWGPTDCQRYKWFLYL